MKTKIISAKNISIRRDKNIL